MYSSAIYIPNAYEYNIEIIEAVCTGIDFLDVSKLYMYQFNGNGFCLRTIEYANKIAGFSVDVEYLVSTKV